MRELCRPPVGWSINTSGTSLRPDRHGSLIPLQNQPKDHPTGYFAPTHLWQHNFRMNIHPSVLDAACFLVRYKPTGGAHHEAHAIYGFSGYPFVDGYP
jgi:hypothetical protein